MKNKIVALLTAIVVFTGFKATAQQINNKYNIIPYPTSLTRGQGNFTITPATTIIDADGGLFKNEATRLNEFFTNSFGIPLKLSNTAKDHAIQLKYDAGVSADEGYHLTITTHQIIIAARTPAGMFMAVQTIRQLLPVNVEYLNTKTVKSLTLPALTVNDEPAYEWRGMHLDVSRHFFSIAYLKKFINIMALYKMNKLHLHLTDDQGWRIEIKKYPKLTEEGAWRTFNNQDSVCMKKAVDNPDFNIDEQHIIHKNGKTLYGGFYTQAEMKALVAYAAERHIDIIPEIDMPGHMMAAINAYPFLTCNGENKWGALFTKPICPCNESTFEFAENVFTEIMDIFPSKYIHIGGDEVDRSDWAKSDACKELMKREGIKDLPALQSYFINRMEKFFNSKGRKLIGWDEIIEGGISPTAMVMYWRGWVPDASLKAVKNGNKVIMTPGSPLYFDYQPDQNSIYNIYHFNPVPKGLTAEEAKLIIGAQANIWTEYIPSENRADYMFMPRMTALAELLWTNNVNDYNGYTTRLTDQFKRLDVLKVHYRLPDLPGMITQNVFTDQDTLSIVKPMPDMQIRYTTDGTLPSKNSQELTGKLIINKSERIRLAAFTSIGGKGDVYDLNYQQQSLSPAVEVDNTRSGLICSYYKAFFKETKFISQATADSTFISDVIAVPQSVKAPSFAIVFSGYINVPSDGVYSFYLTCDDGGVLKIADRETVNNDGLHSAIEKNGQIALKKGLQKFKLDFIEGGGGYTLKLKYSKDGSAPADVPSSWFRN
jgi:hexosaminidase